MNRQNKQPLLFFFLLAAFICQNAQGQSLTKTEIDSMVAVTKQCLPYRDDGKRASAYFKTRQKSTVFTFENKLSVVLEVRSDQDTAFVKEFYSYQNHLVYFEEQHLIYRKNEAAGTDPNEHMQIGYRSYYYVIDDFYAGGDMFYSYDFREYNYSPEPITYTAKMIRQNEKYLQSK